MKNIGTSAWFCARTKPKHEQIAAAHLAKNLKLEVFHPQLRIQKNTRRGVVRVKEPLFPCYIFVHCIIEDWLNEIQYMNGIQSLVHFGGRIPRVGDKIIAELKGFFSNSDIVTVFDQIIPGDEITIGDGAFAGMQAQVLRLLPAKKRVQVLLEVLGGLTPVEVSRSSVVRSKQSLAELMPVLAATGRKNA